MKRFFILMAIACVSTALVAQRATASFVVGGSFVSDSTATNAFVAPSGVTISYDRHLFYEGAASVRMLNTHVAALSLELPVAFVPSQQLVYPGAVDQISSSLFITPGLKVGVLPGAPISPWVSVGGGWARYTRVNVTEIGGALGYGGGLDFNTRLPLLGFRTEVRDFVTGDPSALTLGPGTTTAQGLHHHNVLAGGGIVFRF